MTRSVRSYYYNFVCSLSIGLMHLDIITLLVCDEQCRLWGFSWWRSLQPLFLLNPLDRQRISRRYSVLKPATNVQAPQPHITGKKKTLWSESASKLYRPSDRRLSAKLMPTFADRECHVVSVTDPYGRILGFLDRSRYFFIQEAPQLYSQGWVDPVPDPLLLRNSCSAGNRTRASVSVARYSDH
jgi:CBS-domain-containing membrane protein